jgi:sec-independent protein translocase protein TatA
MPLGWPELIIVLIIVLLVFGPKRLPMLGRQLGGGMREFKDSISRKGGDDAEPDQAAERPELTTAEQPAAPAGQAAAPEESPTRAGRDSA